MESDLFEAIIFIIIGMLLMDVIISSQKKDEVYRKGIKKWQHYFQLFNMWLDMKQQGKEIISYMLQKGYRNVAIYGMSDVGNRLYSELIDSEVNVVCVIDKRKTVLGDFNLIAPTDNIPNVDVIIVCAEISYCKIKKNLESKTDCPIITLSGLLGNAFKRNL